MSDRIINGLGACINSINQVVGPAVEKSGDSLAREQIALMAKYLEFLTQRINFSRDRTRYELQQYVFMGAEILSLLSEKNIEADMLSTCTADAQLCLDNLNATNQQLDETSVLLKAEISRITRSLIKVQPELRKLIEQVVHRHSRSIIDIRRAWCKPQNWESDKDAVPELEAILKTASTFSI
ncbi:MAG: hypothetical protein AB7U63_11415 [Porticoccaceae bacterium]